VTTVLFIFRKSEIRAFGLDKARRRGYDGIVTGTKKESTMISRWTNHRDVFCTVVDVIDGEVCGVPVDILDGEYNLNIEFRSTGYRYSGSWENPPEFDDERTLDSAYLWKDGVTFELPKETQEKLFECFDEDINSQVIDA
jgi:hypothetical protein